jgi:hypothetical protein
MLHNRQGQEVEKTEMIETGITVEIDIISRQAPPARLAGAEDKQGGVYSVVKSSTLIFTFDHPFGFECVR